MNFFRFLFKRIRHVRSASSELKPEVSLFNFQAQPSDFSLWQKLSDAEEYGGDSQITMSQDESTKFLTVQGQLIKNMEHQLETELLFGGAISRHILIRDIDDFNGLRVTLKTNYPLKINLEIRDPMSSTTVYEALWRDTSDTLQTYELPFSHFITKGHESFSQMGSLAGLAVLAENTKNSSFGFQIARIELVKRQELENLRDLGYYLPVMIKYAESYQERLDNFTELFEFHAGKGVKRTVLRQTSGTKESRSEGEPTIKKSFKERVEEKSEVRNSE